MRDKPETDDNNSAETGTVVITGIASPDILSVLYEKNSARRYT